MQRLLNDCVAIVSALGNSKNEPDTCSTAITHIINISEKLKIKRYIEVAGLVIDTPSDKKGLRTRLIGKIIMAFFPKPAQDRQKGYELLNGSKLNWTIIRCPSIELTTNQRTLKVSSEDSPGTKVSATDLAGFIVDQITEEQYFGMCPFVAS
jgi:putative NADH-flavin reductase